MSQPSYQQLDMMDCGAACLQSISKYYGKYFSQQRLRRLCHITKSGVSMLGVSDAAEAIGMRTLGVKLTWEQLKDNAHLPCIVHWNQSHFIVVYAIKKRHGKHVVVVSDPAEGILNYDEEKFLKSWLQIEGHDGKKCGIALLLSPKPEFYNEEEDDEDCNNLLFKAIRYLSPYKRAVAHIMLAMIVASVISLLFPFLTQSIVDVGIGTGDIGFVALILVGQLCLVVGQMVNNVCRSWLMLHVATRISISLVSDFLSKLMRLPIAFFDSKNIGDIIQRIKDNDRIDTFLTGTLISTALSAVTFVVYVFVMSTYSTTILLAFFLGCILYVAWVMAFMRRRRKLDYMHFQQMARNQSTVIQMINGMQEIKLNNCEQNKRWEWELIQAKLFKINTKSLALGNMQNIGGSLVDQIKNIVITFISAKAVIDGRMTLGELVALQYIIGQMNAPLYQFVAFLQSSQDAKISMERMNEIQKMENEETGDDVMSFVIPECGDIELRNVSFQYDGPRSHKVIENLSITIPANKVTAIVGASGSGKTTILKMLLRFFDPVEGDIQLGGINLSSYSVREWRRHCGVVMQEGFIFSDTILNNIAVGDNDIDYERVVSAAHLACIDTFINSLPMGYNTQIGADGHGLSSGQKQRMLIARAIYKNARYIFLDEATNSLDANNEKCIMQNLDTFFKHRTVVVVAHRLSTVRNADNIIVLSHGKIVEQGTHNDLVAAKGVYFELVRNQLLLD